ncbi:MAG TPA: ATP-binding cassette domain-containing protein, partial [Polyangiaceae bacterium]
MAVLCAVDVEKRFGSCVAVSGASLRVEAGRVHAVVGENGAGKSTLLRVMAGQLAPDHGHVEIDGKRLAPHTAAEAIARGVGMVAQHFQLIDALTVLENAILGVEPTGAFGVVDVAAAEAKLEGVLKDLGVKLDVRAQVRDLGVGDRQRLEIARVLYRDARVVILDEPTAVLT